MVLPLIPIAAGAVGVAGGALASIALGKKEASISNQTSTTNQNTYHSPYEVYQPSIQYAPVNSYAYQGATTIINSPNAAAGKLSQAANSSPTQTPEYTTTQTAEPSNSTTGTSGLLGGTVDWTTIAIIGAVAVCGYALLRR